MKTCRKPIFLRIRALAVAFGFAATVLLYPAAALAQNSATGLIVGSVSDANTALLLVGAKVSAAGTALEAYTGRDGSFTLPAVPAGEREPVVGYLGYDSDTTAASAAR